MSVVLTHTIAWHQPDASTPQVPIAASVLPSWVGPSMADLAMILMSASIQMFVTHKLRVPTFQEDLIAVVTQDGEDKGHTLYVLISMNVRKELTSNGLLYNTKLQL